MAEIKEFTWGSPPNTWTTTETFCKACNTIFPYTLVEHICPEQHGRLHKCMRCDLLFECKTEGCQAHFKVLPTKIVNGFQVESHCPDHPNWQWIREHAWAISEQQNFTEGLEMHSYGRCDKRDGDNFSWSCHKQQGHDGACSCHNDCGAVSGDETDPPNCTCGFPPNHCGPHAWERRTPKPKIEPKIDYDCGTYYDNFQDGNGW